MSVEENKALLQRVVEEVFNKRDLGEAMDRYYSVDFMPHNVDIPPGREGFKKYFGGYIQGFPDWTVEIEDMIGEGDRVVAFLSWRGTHKGRFFGHLPSGREVTLRTAEMFRFANGQIVEHWDVLATLPLMETIGAVVSPYKLGGGGGGRSGSRVGTGIP